MLWSSILAVTLSSMWETRTGTPEDSIFRLLVFIRIRDTWTSPDISVIWHNCGTFVEAIVEGGGGTTNNPLNCPVLAQPILTPDFFIPAPATR
jgi:hypothetical protein